MNGRRSSPAFKANPNLRTLPDGRNRIMLEHDRSERAPMKHYFPDEHERGGSSNDARPVMRKAKRLIPARPKRRRPKKDR
jgi:hypothetical protein